MRDDKFLKEMGGEYLEGSGFENEPENTPELSDDYEQQQGGDK
ncbi:MAG: hypothetical protein M0Z41_13835 [Peptococcaceae bacterium]|jgi:hypothetical protein|nr:hypothetical protein [Peptococcaceae bacterium]